MIGPGKYDDAATDARAATQAAGVILIVFGGRHGHGFSCQIHPSMVLDLPELLRQLAADIERDINGAPKH